VTATSISGAPASATGAGELFDRWRRQKDRRARDALIERFLPLARRLARRYAASNEPYDDLVQVASLGLVKAVERFDPSRGYAFTSFAVPTIVGELKRYFRDTGWALHVDRGAQERARRISGAQQAISSSQGRSPTVVELSEFLECSSGEVIDGLKAAEAYDTVSLDAPRMSGGGEAAISRMDGIGDEDERQILYLRFGEDLTQTEIATRIGVSQMQVSRLLRRSLQRLRDMTDDRAQPSGDQ
jgi:RNA polymerase sigma-B factor